MTTQPPIAGAAAPGPPEIAAGPPPRLPEITVAGTPRQLGEAHGEGLRDLIAEVHGWRMGDVRRSTGESESEVLARALRHLPAIRSLAPDLLPEIEGIGRGSGLGFERALFLQVATEVSLEPLAGCSAIGAAAGPHRAPFVAQNWDQPIESAGKQAVVRFAPARKPGVLMFGHAGVVGYIGLNDRGVGHVGNQLYSSAPPARGGLTQYVINRRLLEFERAEDALTWLLSIPVSSTCNYLIGDTTGTLVDVELGGGRAHLQARGPALCHTNHYLGEPGVGTDAAAEVLPDSPARLAALRSHAAEVATLRDHAGHPASICRHEDPPGLSTRASIVLRLGEPSLQVAYGPPCTTPSATFRFESS